MIKQKINKIALFYLIVIIALVVIASCNSNNTSITGFAASDKNSTNATTENTTTTETTNETQLETSKEEKEKPVEKPEKAEPNKPPVWKSDVEEFVLKGKTIIDLSEYFYDANNDSLAYLFTTPEKIEISIDANLVTLTPKGHNFTTTIEFTATDGEKATTKEVNLIVPERTITINLGYKQGTTYDSDNDGYEPTIGVIDLTVGNSLFSWDADASKLCTRWNVQPAEEEKSTTICYGNEKCCNFIGLKPTRDAWDEVFYSVYGQYGATLNNSISAQIIYVDYELSADEPFAEIYYSSWQDLTARYYFASIDFENVCVETCTLTGFNETSYKLIFEIDNAVLNLDTLTYSLVEEISNVLVNLAVKDNEGLASGSYQLYKDNALVSIVEGFVEPDYYNIEIMPKEPVIDKIIIENADITKPLTASIGVDNVSRAISISNVDAKKRYAVNFEELEFEKATLQATANANTLYKCKQWDYEREVCFGTWEKIKDLVPGQQYELILTKDDPGFIEGNINITVTPVNITNITEIGLINDIPNITIVANKNATLDLSEYFSDTDAVFTYFEQGGISILIENGIATIIPAQYFIGTLYTFITVSKNGDSVVSNVFSITVTNVTIDVTPELIAEKEHFELDEDAEFEFEYFTKQELVEYGKWKDEYGVFEEIKEKPEEELKLLQDKLIKKEKQIKKWQTINESIEAFVLDSQGDLKNINVEIEELREGKFHIKLPKPRAFRAGKYTLKLELIKDGSTYTQEQDFTWGVLAINVNKSIYLPNEDAFIGIAVLDDTGKIVCNADVTLEITSPTNQKTILTTSAGDIKISPECSYLGVTELPDYYTSYSVDGVGTYIMNMTAVTQNGVRSIQDNFTVKSSVSFDVARQGPTRVYPKVPYKMRFTINANDDYSGPITEYVPSSFAILPQSDIIVNEIGNVKAITWITDLAKGSTYNLAYEFDAPDTSPEFYVLGALEIGAFKEARQWQIASDQAAGYNFTYPDAGAPGMNLVMGIVGIGFGVSDVISTNSSGNITIGPVVVTDSNGSRADANGEVLSTVFYIHPNATAQDVKVSINGVALPTPFKIIVPLNNSGNLSSKAAGVYGIGNGLNVTRTARGTFVLDELIIPSGVILFINISNGTFDTDATLPGNQGYLPVTFIVDGPVNISGILNVSGRAGWPGSGEFGGVGGDGGPGGGGGGGGGSDFGTPAIGVRGGNGFTGGGGGSCDATCNPGMGGNGTGSAGGTTVSSASVTNAGNGGNSTSPKVDKGQEAKGDTTDGAGGGGGTGFFFGTSGGGGTDGANTDGVGGLGGGGGNFNAHAGGGGFGTNGTGPTRTPGVMNGNSNLVPLTGGSGGGGGGVTTGIGGGGGGGGGGAVLIVARQNITIMPTGQILAYGGNGGDGGNGDGGGGSGGAIVLQAPYVFNGSKLDTSGGTSLAGGAGGNGRIRIDGLDNPAITYFGTAGSNFTGPAIKNITSTNIVGTSNASASIIVYVQQKDGTNTSFTGTANANGVFSIAVTWYAGTNYIAVIQNSTVNTYTVMSSAAVATYDFTTPPDDTPPTVNITNLNASQTIAFGNNLNISAFITGSPTLVNFTFNLTGGTDLYNFSYIISDASLWISQNITVNVTAGNVINASVVACDSNNNCAINSTLVTITELTKPRLNASLNNLSSDFLQGNRVNMTANVTDETQLSWCQFIDNGTLNELSQAQKRYINKTVAGTKDQCSQNYTIELLPRNVINFTVVVNDTSNNKNQSEYANGVIGQLITVLDTTPPVVNTSFNISSPVINDVINFSGNITDGAGLISANITHNISGIITYVNFTVSGTSLQIHNVTKVCSSACVINFTMYATDTSNNVKQNSTLIVVADNVAPVVNTSLNKSLTNIFQGDVLNISANITDETGLLSANITYNISGVITYVNFTISGTRAEIYNVTAITTDVGSVINFSVYATDTSNNVKQNSTLITVVSANQPPVIALNNVTGANPQFAVDPFAGRSSIILISFNVTDPQGVSDINASKAIVNLTLGTPDVAQFRFNVSDAGGEFGTCKNHTQGSTVIINCTIIMRYYDNASSAWVVNVSVADLSGSIGRNDTLTFIYNSLAAFSLIARGVSEGANLNFSSLFLNDQNKVAKAPLLLNNTGNNDFDQINITAAALIGLQTASEIIAASSFAVNVTNNTNGLGLPLSNAPQIIPFSDASNATLLHGPGISGDNVPYPGVADFKTKGNQTLLFWIDVPAYGLSAQTYNNTWNITVVDLS